MATNKQTAKMATRTGTLTAAPSPQPSVREKTVIFFENNDLPDLDNDAQKLLFEIGFHLSKERFPKGAVQKYVVLEPHKVNLGIRRIQGRNIPTFLTPMFKFLFSKGGPIEKYRNTFSPAVIKDLDRVLERREISAGSASTFMRADLTKALVDAIVSHEQIIEGLVRALKADKASIKDQLMTCVPSKDPQDSDGSILAAKLYVQDYIKVLEEHGRLEDGDKVYLDCGGLPHLKSPLEARVEHPGHFVNNPDLVEFYQHQMNSGLSEENIRGNMRAKIQQTLDPECQKRIVSTISGPNRYKTFIEAGKKAEKIFFFGGSSLALLNALLSAGLKDKIEFVGQGGVKDQTMTLTGNSFNWDLNPSAAFSVLNRQAETATQIPEFILGSTELGKSRVFPGPNLATIFALHQHDRSGNRVPPNKRFGRRIAAYGCIALKTNPEKFILEAKMIDNFHAAEKAVKAAAKRDVKPSPEHLKLVRDPEKRKEVEEATKRYEGYLGNDPVQCADLAAFLAAYCKSFRTKHCREWKPKHMFIVKQRDQSGGELAAVERVRFDDHPGKKAEREVRKELNGSVTLYMPKPTSDGKPETVTLTEAMIEEVKQAMLEKVSAALGIKPSPRRAATQPANGQVKSGTTTTATAGNPQANTPRSLSMPVDRTANGASATGNPNLATRPSTGSQPASRGSGQATSAPVCPDGAPRHSAGVPPAVVSTTRVNSGTQRRESGHSGRTAGGTGVDPNQAKMSRGSGTTVRKQPPGGP